MTGQLTPKGAAGFSTVLKAQGFKGSEENKTYGQELVLTKEEAKPFLEQLQKEADRLYAVEVEKLKAKGSATRIQPTEPPYKELPDGRLSFNFRRKEIDGAPMLIDAENKPFTGLIRRDNILQIAYEVRPYLLQRSIFRVSLRLMVVKVIETSDASSAVGLFGPAKEAKTVDKNPLDLF